MLEGWSDWGVPLTVGRARCLEEQQNHHRGTATSPGICTVLANGGVPNGGVTTTAKELDMWTPVSGLIQT